MVEKRRPAPKGRGKASTRRPAKKRGKRSAGRSRSWVWRFRRVLFLFAVLVVTALAGALFVISQVPLPPEHFEAQTTFVYDAAGTQIASLYDGEDRVVVPLTQVPSVLQDAVLAAEDRNFFRHSGIDPVGIVRATWSDLRSKGPLQGGSTITQQYVKNAYLGRERTLLRKLKEAVISVKLERKLDKAEILGRYLNTIYLGRGAYGVQAASRAWFGKDVDRLSLPEAAYLAGLIRAPESADLERAPAVAEARRAGVLQAMVRTGAIDEQQRAAATAVPLPSLVVPRKGRALRVSRPEIGTDYVIDYVRRVLSRTYGDAEVFGGGLRVHTTIDLDMQADAFAAVDATLGRAGDPAAALVAVDDAGRVRAMVGGSDYQTSKVNLAVGRAGGGSGRQPGSAFKPFLLAEAVSEGYTVESAFPAPATIILPKANDGKDYPVRNYEEASFAGPINLIEATKHSVNTVYAQLIRKIGPKKLVTMAGRLGITSPLEPNVSLTLGTNEVSVLEMAGAYSTLARRGVRVDPVLITKITGPGGQVLHRAALSRERVLEEKHADIVTFCLRQVVIGGTGTAAGIGRPVAGKTGTTQNYGDAWFVGYTPQLTTAVWMGYPEGNEKRMTSVHGIKVTGGSFPAAIFRRFMTAALKGQPVEGFPSVTSFRGNVLTAERLKFGTTTTAKSSTTTSSLPPKVTTTTLSPGLITTSTSPGQSTSSTSSTTSSPSTSTTSSTTSTTRPPNPVPTTAPP